MKRPCDFVCCASGSIAVSSCEATKQVSRMRMDTNGSLYASEPTYGSEITNFGATVTSITAPDRNGKLADVVLGFKISRTIQTAPELRHLGCTLRHRSLKDASR